MKSIFRAVRLILTLNCEESARLTSEGLDRELSFAERTAIFFHNSICKKSRKLARQIKLLDSVIRSSVNPSTVGNIESEPSPALSQSARKRIQQEILNTLRK